MKKSMRTKTMKKKLILSELCQFLENMVENVNKADKSSMITHKEIEAIYWQNQAILVENLKRRGYYG